MGKYSQIESAVFSVFGNASWKSENIKTFPVNFITINQGNEFIRVSTLPNGSGININSISGICIIEIFIPAGNGPKRSSIIADKLDQYLVGKSFMIDTSSIQFMNSSLRIGGVDSDNPALFRSFYEIQFNYFGVK